MDSPSARNRPTEDALEQSERLEQMQQEQLGSLHDLKETVLANQSKSPRHNFSGDDVSQLPSPWEQHFSDAHNIPYYFNPHTGESSWVQPKIEANTAKTSDDQPHYDQEYEHDNDEDDEDEDEQEEDSGYMDENEEEALYERLRQLKHGKSEQPSPSQHRLSHHNSPPNNNQTNLTSQSSIRRQHSSSSTGPSRDKERSPSTVNSPSSPAVSTRHAVSITQQREQVELMYFRAEETSLRKEARRQEYINQQEQELTGRPTLDTKGYKSQANWDSMTLAERSARQHAQKIAKEALIREQLEKEEKEAMRSKPVITKKSRDLAPRRGVDDMLAWDQERRER